MRCPRPILGVPRRAAPIEKALLAYDGSPRSEEALYLAATLAETWGIDLVVVTVEKSKIKAADLLSRAGDYLSNHGIEAVEIHLSGNPGKRILAAAEIHECDAILLGGYGARPVVEMVLGSTADRVLRECKRAVFICQ